MFNQGAYNRSGITALSQAGLGDLSVAAFPQLAKPAYTIAGRPAPECGVGDLVPALFTTPNNPLKLAMAASMVPPPGVGPGMGFDFSSLDTGVDWTKWAVIGGGLVLAWWLISRPKGYRQARREAIARVKKQYPRGYTRAKAAAKKGYEYGASTGRVWGF